MTLSVMMTLGGKASLELHDEGYVVLTNSAQQQITLRPKTLDAIVKFWPELRRRLSR